MALRTFVSAGVFDTHVGTTTISTSTTSITAAGVTSAGFTAPNLVNAATGAWVYIATIPTTINVIVELQESTVTKATATMNNADIKLGWNYARFTTPYEWQSLNVMFDEFVLTENDVPLTETPAPPKSRQVWNV